MKLFLFAFLAAGTSLAAHWHPVADGGYDATTYVEGKKPVLGSPRHTVDYAEETWYFANWENQQAFQKDPEKYLPAYDGWCALSIAEGKKVAGDAYLFNSYQGKTYLLCNPTALKKWLADPEKYRKEADEQWNKMGAR